MVLSHSSKTRIIAEAKIKTDKVDSKNLAKLLRADFLSEGDRSTEIAANCT
jgi:transposase